MIDFNNNDLFLLEKLVVSRIHDLESSYRRMINIDYEGADSVGLLAGHYFLLLQKIHPGYNYITESDSFHAYLCA